MNENLNTFEFLLSREELQLILNLLDSDWIPGFEFNSLGELSDEEQALGLLYAERALRARELAVLREDGKLLVNNDLLKNVGICAYAQKAIIVTYFENEFPNRFIAFEREGQIVVQKIPEPGLHYFARIPDSKSLWQQLFGFCQFNDIANNQTKQTDLIIPAEIISKTRDLASSGQSQPAIEYLTNVGVTDQASQEIVGILSGPHKVAIFEVLVIPEDQIIHRHGMSVFYNDLVRLIDR